MTFSKSTLLELRFCHDTLAFQPPQIFTLGFHVQFECRWTKNNVGDISWLVFNSNEIPDVIFDFIPFLHLSCDQWERKMSNKIIILCLFIYVFKSLQTNNFDFHCQSKAIFAQFNMISSDPVTVKCYTFENSMLNKI